MSKNKSMETQPSKPRQTPERPSIEDVVQTIDFKTGESKTIESIAGLPVVAGYVDYESAPEAKLNVIPGVYGLSLDGQPVIDKKYSQRAGKSLDNWSSNNAQLLERDPESGAPVLLQGKDGFSWRVSPDNEGAIAVFSINEAGERTGKLLGSDDEHVGTYIPKQGDVVVIAEHEALQNALTTLDVQANFSELLATKEIPSISITMTDDVCKSMQAGAVAVSKKAKTNALPKEAEPTSTSEEAQSTKTVNPVEIRKMLRDHKSNKINKTSSKADDTADQLPFFSVEQEELLDSLYDRTVGQRIDEDIHAQQAAEAEAKLDEDRGFTVTEKRHNLKIAATKTEKVPGKELELYTGTPSETTTISDASTPLMDMVRLARNVETYTEKVQAYEQIAAEALAKRMKGRLYNPLTKRNKDIAAKEALNMHLLEGFSRALDGAKMKQWLAEGYSDEEVATMIHQEQQTREEARAAINHAELRKGKVASFLDRYANMSKGKKVGFAIGATAAIGAMGVVVGAAGGAMAVVGGVGLATAKVGKTYMQHKSKIYKSSPDASTPVSDAFVVSTEGEVVKRSASEQVFAGMKHDEQKREKAIKEADRNKKIAAGLAGASALLIGAGLAVKITEHSDDIRSLFRAATAPANPDIVDSIKNPEVTVTAPDVPAPELPIEEVELVPSPEVDATTPTPEASLDYNFDASNVVAGEGWYQTFGEMGIPAYEQAELLNKIGPALAEKNWAYPMSDGSWGISRPGVLPTDVIELIKNSR